MTGSRLADIPKSNVFTSKLPADPKFPTPSSSHAAERSQLGPRRVEHALFTYVRPDPPEEAEVLAVSDAALDDIGLRRDETNTQLFKDTVSGARITTWNEQEKEEAQQPGIYPWAQCYGGYQFGHWAGQLGDGRAISLYEATNPVTQVRYEIQLKGAGRTPYSRFADGKAVLRSSIREFIVSEALHALHIPTTRALALTLTPKARVQRERIEPGAIVTRFAQSWIRIGTFDLLWHRRDRKLTRQLATYVAENVFGGWENLARKPADGVPGEPNGTTTDGKTFSYGLPAHTIEGADLHAENRFGRLLREIVIRNARTTAAWQAYGFMNGVLNTDNTSVMGLSMDFGPFAFMDNFDRSYTPNHDDVEGRYSYRNQRAVIASNLTRLGQTLLELIVAGPDVDREDFIEDAHGGEMRERHFARMQPLMTEILGVYAPVFDREYNRLMAGRLGLKTVRGRGGGEGKGREFEAFVKEWLDILEAHELDFNHSFRRLSGIKLADIETHDARLSIAGRFFHREGYNGPPAQEQLARKRIAEWLDEWRARIIDDWGAQGPNSTDGKEKSQENETETENARMAAMKSTNPNFLPRSWILDEVIRRVEHGGEREFLRRVLHMALHPFEERWGWDEGEEERLCGDVPREGRAMQCSCSS